VATLAVSPAAPAKTDNKDTGRRTSSAATPANPPDDTSVERRSPTPGSADETGPEVGGPSSHDQTGPTTKALIARARSIRKALDQDPTTAHENVQVIPHAGDITIRGRVSSSAMRRKIERLVKDAAPDANLKFDLTAPNQ
jgi:hypothetical protein